MVLIDVLDQYRVLTVHIIHLFVDGIQLVPLEEIPIQPWGFANPKHHHPSISFGLTSEAHEVLRNRVLLELQQERTLYINPCVCPEPPSTKLQVLISILDSIIIFMVHV